MRTMKPTMKRAPWLMLALGLIGGVGSACDTRVVQLQPPVRDARPPDSTAAKCSDYTREDGAACRLCFTADGVLLTPECTGPTMTMTVPDANVPAPEPAPLICKVEVLADSMRCLTCPTVNNGNVNSVCLKCDARQMSSSGGVCRVCVWSDNPMVRCLQCFAEDGKTLEDGCDGLRKEKLVYNPSPMGA
jgi:hypothetical protein